MHIMSLHRFRSWDLQVPAPHPPSGRNLASPKAPSLSEVQGATGHPAVHTQSLHACPADIPPVLHCYGLLPVPANQETLLCFTTFLADAKVLQKRTILGYLYGVRALHIDMGLSDPLKGALWLHKGLLAIHIQSNPASHKLAFTYKLLVLTHPLHKFPAQLVLWAALIMAHFCFFQMGEFMVDQKNLQPNTALVGPGCYT